MRHAVHAIFALVLVQVLASGATAQPNLFISGFCPDAPGAITVRGATIGGNVAIAAASGIGSSVVPAGLCAGTELGLDAPILVGILPVDAEGVASLETQLPAFACGWSVQALDLSDCVATPVVDMPVEGSYSDLRVAVRTGDGANDGSDDSFEFCVSESQCWALADNLEPDNEFDHLFPDRVEETVIDVESLSLDDIGSLRLRPTIGTDAWKPTCLSVVLDGDLLYCNDGENGLGESFIGTEPTDLPEYVDSDRFFRNCSTCYGGAVSHGPLIGHTESDRSNIWIRTGSEQPVEIRYAPDPLQPSNTVLADGGVTSSADDFTTTVSVDGLALPGTSYPFDVLVNGRVEASSQFVSAPAGPTSFTVAFGSCANPTEDDGGVDFSEMPIFDDISTRDPDLLIMLGDNHYANSSERETLHAFYRRGREMASFSSLVAETPTWAVWDDHDYTGNNDVGDEPGKDTALAAFERYWANDFYGSDGVPGVWSKFSWGDVDFYLLDGRYHRDVPDFGDCPQEPAEPGTFLGVAQLDWLISDLETSVATFKVLALGSQWNEPGGSDDSFACFSAERDLLLDQIMHAGIEGVVLLSGDVHRLEAWTVREESELDYPLWEFTASPFGHATSNCISADVGQPGFEFCYSGDEGGGVGLPYEAYGLLHIDTAAEPPTLVFEAFGGKPGESIASLDTVSLELSEDPQFGLSERGQRDQLWHQDRYGIDGGVEAGDRFGAAVAAGDFDGDGFDDLAVGIPDEDLESNSVVDAGAVAVLYGSLGRLSMRDLFLDQNDLSAVEANEANDHFGSVVAVGDFDGDGFEDLAVGTPDEDIGAATDTGAVWVAYGSATGVSTDGSQQFWDQAALGFANATGDRFATALATGDFDGDGFDDLAVGAPGRAVAGDAGAGAAYVIYGSENSGLVVGGVQLWTQDETPSTGSEPGDGYGHALAAGDFDDDGFDDLAVGVPFEDVLANTIVDGGGVEVLEGSGAGLFGETAEFWWQNDGGVPDDAEAGDQMGWSLAVGDFDRDPIAGNGPMDLAIGAPGESIDGESESGAVFVFYGTTGVGLRGVGSQIWEQDQPGVRGSAEAGDRFGESVAAGDPNADGTDDLFVGVPFDDIVSNTVADAGLVQILYGLPIAGIQADAPNDLIWTQNEAGIKDVPEAGDAFGTAIAIGDFDGDGIDDAAVGLPSEDVVDPDGDQADAGAVHLIYGD